MLEEFKNRSLTNGDVLFRKDGGFLISRKTNIFLIFSLLFYANLIVFDLRGLCPWLHYERRLAWWMFFNTPVNYCRSNMFPVFPLCSLVIRVRLKKSLKNFRFYLVSIGAYSGKPLHSTWFNSWRQKEKGDRIIGTLNVAWYFLKTDAVLPNFSRLVDALAIVLFSIRRLRGKFWPSNASVRLF